MISVHHLVDETTKDMASVRKDDSDSGSFGSAAECAATNLNRSDSTYFDYAMRNPGVSVIARPLSYPLLALGPLFLAMAGMGFSYRDKCQQHNHIPQFLFFAGLSGSFAAILRLSLVLKWRSIKEKYDKE